MLGRDSIRNVVSFARDQSAALYCFYETAFDIWTSFDTFSTSVKEAFETSEKILSIVYNLPGAVATAEC